MLTENLFDIVAFDNVAVISQPLTHVDEKNFSIIADNIRKITPRDRTNIADVIKTTKSMITVKLAKQYNCKIILCSDGEANVGISDENSLAPIALDCMRSGITVSALGMGVSYNARIMGSIANSGGGIFHHIEDLSKLPDIFKKELGLSTSVLAREVKLILEIPKLIEIGQNLNGYPQSVSIIPWKSLLAIYMQQEGLSLKSDAIFIQNKSP